MKPDWDALAAEYKDSTTSLVADVDCTAAGKDLCEKHEVKGFPTIKYGDPNDLQDYKGGRELEDLKTFAAENLGPQCGLGHLELCDEERKAKIEKYVAMTDDELKAILADAEAKVKKIEDNSLKTLEKLETKKQELSEMVDKETKKKEDQVAKENAKTGLRMMQAVANDKKKKEAGAEKKKSRKKKGKKEL